MVVLATLAVADADDPSLVGARQRPGEFRALDHESLFFKQADHRDRRLDEGPVAEVAAVFLAEGREELAAAQDRAAGKTERNLAFFPLAVPAIEAVPKDVVICMKGEHFAELHHRAELDALKVEAVVDRRVAAGDEAEVFLRSGSAKGDRGVQVRMKVEPAFFLLLQMRMVLAAGEMGGVAVVVIADRLRGGGEQRGDEKEDGGTDH